MTPEELANAVTNKWAVETEEELYAPNCEWERLDELIAAAIRVAVKAEREACAQIANDFAVTANVVFDGRTATLIEQTIRARGDHIVDANKKGERG